MCGCHQTNEPQVAPNMSLECDDNHWDSISSTEASRGAPSNILEQADVSLQCFAQSAALDSCHGFKEMALLAKNARVVFAHLHVAGQEVCYFQMAKLGSPVMCAAAIARAQQRISACRQQSRHIIQPALPSCSHQRRCPCSTGKTDNHFLRRPQRSLVRPSCCLERL